MVILGTALGACALLAVASAKPPQGAPAGARVVIPATAKVVTPRAAKADVVAVEKVALPGRGTAAGARIAIDPETGERRAPTPEEAKALREAARAARGGFEVEGAPETVRVIHHANGMVSAELGEAFMEDVVARRGADGKVTIGCEHHADVEVK